jgi:hypothetical protein
LITSRLNIKAQFIAIDEFSSMPKTTELSKLNLIFDFRNLSKFAHKSQNLVDLILKNLKNGTIDFVSGYFDNSTIYGDGFITTAPVYSVSFT